MFTSFCFASDNLSSTTSDPNSPGSLVLSCIFDGWEDYASSSSWFVRILVTVYPLSTFSLSTFSICVFSLLSSLYSLYSSICFICAFLIFESYSSSSSFFCDATLLISRNYSKEVPPKTTSSFLPSFTVLCILPDLSFNPRFRECGEFWCVIYGFITFTPNAVWGFD